MNNYSSQPQDVLGSYHEAAIGGQYHAPDDLYDTLDLLQQNAPKQAASLKLQDIQPVDQSPFAPGAHVLFTDARNHVTVPLRRSQSCRSKGVKGSGSVRRSVKSSVTASDSAYGSLHVTSGPTPVSFPTYAVNESFNQLQDSNVPNQNFGSGSVVSEPLVVDRSDAQGRRPKRGRNGPPQSPCNVCQRPLRNPSEAQKHYQTHYKQWPCTVPGCTRRQGFGTKNDLDRHLSSVHKRGREFGSRDGFICVACPRPQNGIPKFWPRKDNFKAHVRRKHAQHDTEHVILLSATIRPQNAQTVESGYMSAQQSQMDPNDMDHNQMTYSSTGTGPSQHTSQPGELIHAFGGSSQGEVLAGISGALPMMVPSFDGQPMDGSSFAADGGSTFVALRSGTLAGTVPSLNTSMLPPQNNHRMNMPSFLISEHNTVAAMSASVPEKKWPCPQQDVFYMPGAVPPLVDQAMQDAEPMVKCPKCPKKKKRDCDLRKHMKRHERLYGCTFPSCFKRFGSRNDWKRHESTQHFHQEMWRCPVEDAAGAPCGEVFHEPGLTREHLQIAHGRKGDDSTMQLIHMGRNAHDNYWCGFCKCLIPQESASMHHNTLEARYKHIGDHFDKNYHINNWICVKARRAKGPLAAEHKRKMKTHSRNKCYEDDSDLGDSGIPDQPDQRGQTALATMSSSSRQAHVPAMATTRDALYTCNNTKSRRVPVLNDDDDAEGVSDDELYG